MHSLYLSMSAIPYILSQVSAGELERLMVRLPSMFRQELSGVGATLEKRWKFCGFDSLSSAWHRESLLPFNIMLEIQQCIGQWYFQNQTLETVEAADIQTSEKRKSQVTSNFLILHWGDIIDMGWLQICATTRGMATGPRIYLTGWHFTMFMLRGLQTRVSLMVRALLVQQPKSTEVQR